MKQKILHTCPPLGEGVVRSQPPGSEQFPPSLGRLSQGRFDERLEGLAAAWGTGYGTLNFAAGMLFLAIPEQV